MLESRPMRRFWAAPLLATCCLAAQTSGKVEITSEPNHRLALENSYVRVFEVEVPPGGATLVHYHRHDYISVNLGLAEILNQVEGKPAVTVKLEAGHTAFAEGNFAHSVRNRGATSFRNVTVELLQDEKARRSPPPGWDEDRALHILEGGTLHIMFVKDGVRVSETDLQPGGMIPSSHPPGPQLLVAVTDLDLENRVAGKGISPIRLKSGDVRWLPGRLSHTVMNVGKQQARFVSLEFH
jgi:oxalate decarboxylase/phosphoglucose isomerase-like protein (cupin superfamily)